ncbi:hypothetical protein [Fluviicola chungangensis]|uniref:PA14 domain-containing protein n=1 Tax=Fluviicola chungangensis TaxID=2597671 RepID=A0A556MPH5_9FLAO|nr:hypothetical protein [Fluviicola chungangensis]TSJ41864.1 hypothetical protein FO442_12285 [Fluviicola chungangensis]
MRIIQKLKINRQKSKITGLTGKIDVKQADLRMEVFALAVLVFIQSISPVFARGTEPVYIEDVRGENAAMVQVIEAYPDIQNNETEYQPEIDPNAEIQRVETPNEQPASYVVRIPGGPDQPEASGFTPIGADNMVDLFTGDFSYNIPLLDIDGYPINMAYSAGVGMEQEASWVGLGWSLNPGVINRNMRGIPDDFNGIDKITQDYNQRPNWTVGTSVAGNYELFALTLGQGNETDTNGSVSISAKLGIQYNNYQGFGADFSLGGSFSIAKKLGFDVGLEFTGSSQGGATIGLNAGLSLTDKQAKNRLGIGSALNSREGLQQVSVDYSRNYNIKNNYRKITDSKKNAVGNTPGTTGGGGGASFAFGTSTYVAQIPFDTKANSFTAKFKLGGDAAGNDLTGEFSGFFSKSTLSGNQKIVSAYGYNNLQFGQNNYTAMLDFNRENNSNFTKNTPALPIPHLMYDTYSVSGQGVSGSYRLDRQDIGYVFDPLITSSSDSYTLGGEFGMGATFKAGIDVGAVFSNGYSMAWKEGNDASSVANFYSRTNYYREASEMAVDESDVNFNNIGGSQAAFFQLKGVKTLSGTLETTSGNTYVSPFTKSAKFRRNQPLTSYTISEVKNGFGPTRLPLNSYANTQPLINHHNGAFTVTKTDGSRYYYGLPAYNITQKNVSFAISGATPDWNSRLVSYSSEDASINNQRGLDRHYNSQTIPGYAHSYMLTAVLSKDYVDADAISGPSKGDLGGYVEFKYKQIANYKWRNPVQENQAFHDNGLNADPTDERANYIYGEKELWYLDTIKTKNHLVIFYTSDRKDAVSVTGESGGLNSGGTKMQQLDSLKLYSLRDFELNGALAKSIKTVHFGYSYRLCRNYSGNIEATSSDPLKGGKLTLDSVYFTYENSYKGEKTPYKFVYGFNPDYNPNSIDRWGTYKPSPTGLTGNALDDSEMTNAENPYVGTNKTNSDLYASAWNLSQIKLPTGGMIEVIYESDDYAFVQHKRAKQMFKITGVEDCSGSVCSVSTDDHKNLKLYFEMLPGTTITDYVNVGDLIYFRALLSMNDNGDRYDYVPGYARVDYVGSSGNSGIIGLNPGKMKDSENSAEYNPIAVSGVQFARNYLSRLIPPSGQEQPEDATFMDFVDALLGAFSSFQELFIGPNKPLYNLEIGTKLRVNKSFIRLNNPNYAKLGGGYRVKEIRTYDNWDNMVTTGTESCYKQKYEYSFDGKSSGVASYEPIIGGEENAWRSYVANDISKTWAPDIRNYMETPFGEQLFPMATVGYGKVLVKNVSPSNVTKTATGYTISEFYTAKDFPTITDRTKVDKKPMKFNLNLLLYARSEDRLAVSQGFVIENNDMHGKPKSVKMYGEGQTTAFSSVEYFYQSSPGYVDGIAANALNNTVTVIQPDGNIKSVVVGRTYEAVSDFRENTSDMYSANIGINLNYTMPFVFIPMILGSNFSESKTEFRSAVFAKSIERKGILSKTVAMDNQSVIQTENLAYDSETGDILLTSVNNNYRDIVYNFTYPAHWVYNGMGQAYRNLGYTSTITKTFSDGYCSGFNNTQLVPGDEVMVLQSGNYVKGWVTESGATGVRILKKDGTPLSGSITYLKVLRSGNRNLQATPVGSIALMKNPLNTLTGNILDQVLSAQSIEYSDAWKSYCECTEDEGNPYVTGIKGNWNPKADYTHLSGRTQTYENNNTNIRIDGIMKSFLPFFRLLNGKWMLNKESWTSVSEVTEFSPNGQGLETRDALDRYSTTQLGYNQTLPVAVSVNSERTQSGYTGFEDYLYNNCQDKHFKLGENANLTSSDAHTGKYSLSVSSGSPIVLQKKINNDCPEDTPCDFSSYQTGSPVHTVRVMASEGVTMTYDIIHGTPAPQLTEIVGGYQISFTAAGAFLVNVKLTKAPGCVITIPVSTQP